MPAMKLNVSAVTTSQVSHRRQPGAQPVLAPCEPERGDAQDERGREQPGDLAADLGVEQAEQAGLAPAAGASGPPPPTEPISLPLSRPKPL